MNICPEYMIAFDQAHSQGHAYVEAHEGETTACELCGYSGVVGTTITANGIVEEKEDGTFVPWIIIRCNRRCVNGVPL